MCRENLRKYGVSGKVTFLSLCCKEIEIKMFFFYLN